MRRAGFNSMMITPEAASERMLRSLCKGFGVEEVRTAARLARASGITSMWFFMLGGPGETRETVDETVSFVERHLDGPNCVSIFTTGVRVLPGTALARDAVREGAIAADRDLARPTFYLSPQVDEEWVLGRINQAMRRCPAIVHAAEEGTSTYERVMDRALAMAGVAPPYWRFLPSLLGSRPCRCSGGAVLRWAGRGHGEDGCNAGARPTSARTSPPTPAGCGRVSTPTAPSRRRRNLSRAAAS